MLGVWGESIGAVLNAQSERSALPFSVGEDGTIGRGALRETAPEQIDMEDGGSVVGDVRPGKLTNKIQAIRDWIRLW